MVTYKLVKHQNMTSTKISNKTSNTYDKIHELKMKYDAQLDELYDNKNTNLYPQFNHYLDLERYYKRADEYYEIHGEYPPRIDAMFHSKKRRKLENKYYVELHRLKRKMRQNAVMIYIFYNYVSSNLLNVPLLFSYLLYQ